MSRARRWMVVLITGVVLLGALAFFSPAEAKPCHRCQAQPWCGCTYNGYPRISCDPCCYSTGWGQICTS